MPHSRKEIHSTENHSDNVSGSDSEYSRASGLHDSPWDLAIEYILAPLLLFMPLAFGVVEPWSELIVMLAVAAMSLCLLGKLVTQKGATFQWSWTYVPVGLFIALVGIQLLPLPAGLVHLISPATGRVKAELLGDIPGAAKVLNPIMLTFYSLGTLHDLEVVLVASALLVIVANTFRTPRQVRRLLMVVAGIGGVIGLFTVVQDLCHTHEIYGVYPLPAAGDATGGPFVNRSHLAQFMNLSMGFALGLLLVRLKEIFPGKKELMLSRLLAPWKEPDVWAVWLGAGVLVIGAIAVALSLSRAGLVSMVAAGMAAVIAIGLSRKSSGGGSLLTLLAVVVFAAVLYLGADSISQRYNTARDIATAGGRLQRLVDLRPLWKSFPLLGTGLGTHETVFPKFDTSINPTAPQYLEVELAQVMEEMGALGVLLVAIFVGGICNNIMRGVRRKHAIHGAAYGLAFGLGAVFLHSFTDFGQHLMSNASLSAISCGLIVALSRSMRYSRTESVESEPQPSSLTETVGRRRAGIAASAVVAGLLLVMLPNAISAERAAWHEDRAETIAAHLGHNKWDGMFSQYRGLLSEAEQACAIRPNDVFYQYNLNLYRWQSINHNVLPDDEPVSIAPESQPTTAESQPTTRASDHPETPSVEWITFARRIVDDLQQTRLLCSSYGPAVALQGEIEYELKQPQAPAHIRLGASLSPHDPITCMICGELEARENRPDRAIQLFKRAMALDPSVGDTIIQFWIDEKLDNADLPFQVAPETPQWLMRVANAFDQHKLQPVISRKWRDKAVLLLMDIVRQPDAQAEDLALMGNVYFQSGEFKNAAEYYARATDLDYAQAGWHKILAISLEKLGKPDQANYEARIAKRSLPEDAELDALLARTAKSSPASGPSVP